MTDQRRGGSARGEEQQPGYRGALPPRTDSLARPWVLIVLVIFILIFALSLANVPTTLFPSPTPAPLPSLSAAPSGSAGASGSARASPSASPIPSGSATP
jgi:hypothetical protein